MKDLCTQVIELQNDVDNAKRAFSLLEDAGLPARQQWDLMTWIEEKKKELASLEEKLEAVS